MKLLDVLFKRNLETSLPQAPILKETAWSSETFFGQNSGKFPIYDPDQLKLKKGADIYRKMLRDPQIKAAFNLVIDLITSRQYRFEKTEDTPLQRDIEDFFRYNIEIAIRGTWTQVMRTVMMAKAYGYSVSEKIYTVGQFEGRDKWMLANVKAKPYETFEFQQDVFGNLTGLTQEVSGKRISLDPQKFIIYVAYPELDPIFGESDLRAAYRPYWEKDILLKLWNIYLEKMASGFIKAQPGESAATLSAAEMTDFKNALKRVVSGTSMTVPQGWDVSVEHGPTTDAYERAITHKDKQISKSLLVPNMLGFSEQGSTGSFAQAQTQLDIFFKIVASQGEQLADTLNEQLFRELAFWNYGVTKFPRFMFEPYTDEQKRTIAESWIAAVKDGVVINTYNDEQRTRELLLYDPREEEEEPLENPNSGEEQTDDIETDPEEKEEIEREEEKPDVEAEMAATNVPSPSDNTTPALISGNNTHIESPNVTENVISASPWMDRLDFVEIEQGLDKNEDRFVSDLGEAVDLAYRELVTAITEVVSEAPDKTTEDTSDKDQTDIERDIARIQNSITPTTKSAMNQAVKSNLRVAYEGGRITAQGAIDSNLEASQVNANMKSKISLAARTSQRVAIKHTRGKDYLWSVVDFAEGLRKDTAEKYFAAKAFEITGVITDDMTEKAQTIILNGIKNELSIDEIIEELNDVLQPLIGKKDPDTGQPDKQERARLETIARTNIIDSFNQAQLAVYTDPDLGDFVEAYQYSSIIDSRTTDFCEAYNGRIFLKDDPVWNHITPPNHFNCRSTFVPVTVLDDYTVSGKARTSGGELVQPANGFGTIGG